VHFIHAYAHVQAVAAVLQEDADAAELAAFLERELL
jgi:hypothetical protein